LFEGGFEVIDDFLGEDIKISNITPGPPACTPADYGNGGK
jgi:hypothetical protein